MDIKMLTIPKHNHTKNINGVCSRRNIDRSLTTSYPVRKLVKGLLNRSKEINEMKSQWPFVVSKAMELGKKWPEEEEFKICQKNVS